MAERDRKPEGNAVRDVAVAVGREEQALIRTQTKVAKLSGSVLPEEGKGLRAGWCPRTRVQAIRSTLRLVAAGAAEPDRGGLFEELAELVSGATAIEDRDHVAREQLGVAGRNDQVIVTPD